MSFKTIDADLGAIDRLFTELFSSCTEFPLTRKALNISPSKGAHIFRAAAGEIPFPEIERVIYNDPVTKVYFKDGTNVIVKTSKDDKFSKEIGLVYAIVKRLYGKPTPNGEVLSNGYMIKLKNISEAGYDQKAEAARRAEAKKKKADAEAKAEETPPPAE